MGLSGRVRRTGLIPRRDVLAIVRGAVAMTFPSRYEGFGLPGPRGDEPRHARCCRPTPAPCPRWPAAPARLLPVDDPDAWVDGMTQMLEDGDERQRLVDGRPRPRHRLHLAPHGGLHPGRVPRGAAKVAARSDEEATP